jgi:hypothetical protein
MADPCRTLTHVSVSQDGPARLDVSTTSHDEPICAASAIGISSWSAWRQAHARLLSQSELSRGLRGSGQESRRGRLACQGIGSMMRS